MPPLKPFDASQGILEDAGLLSKPITSFKNASEELKEKLRNSGGGLDAVAYTLTDLMARAENENVRLAAAKMIAAAQGALNDMDDAAPPVINFNIITSDNSQTMINILMPKGRN